MTAGEFSPANQRRYAHLPVLASMGEVLGAMMQDTSIYGNVRCFVGGRALVFLISLWPLISSIQYIYTYGIHLGQGWATFLNERAKKNTQIMP
jgi:hypothetical protein